MAHRQSKSSRFAFTAVCAIVATLLMSALFDTEPFAQSSRGQFVITDVRVFDGEQVLADRTVVVRKGLIDTISATVPRDAESHARIDGEGATLLPGLMDAHTHTTTPTQLKEALRFGVTTVFDMWTPTGETVLRKAALDRDDVADFRSTGLLATAPGGHGTEYGVKFPTVSSPADAESFVEARKSSGADYLKIVLNGVRAQQQGTPILDRATVLALVTAAHARSLRVVAHIESADDARLAVESGVDGLAHVWRDRGAAPDLSRLLAQRAVFVIATLAVPDGFVEGAGARLVSDGRLRPFLPPESIARFSSPQYPPGRAEIIKVSAPRLRRVTIEAVADLAAAGVKLLAGTDGSDIANLPTAHGVSVHRELELLVEAGMRPADALAAATKNIAEAFGLDDRGRIVSGRRADLLLVRGDPTSDITATRHILRIWKAGIEFDRRLP